LFIVRLNQQGADRRMSILSSLGLVPTAVVDDDVAPPSMSRLLRHVADGAYQEAGKLLLSTSDENRECLIDAFARQDDAVTLAQQWVRSCGASSIAHTMLGASLIHSAWKIRGNSYAEAVDEAAWQPFENGLERAAEPLLEAARLDTAAADPFAWLILAEVGKSGDRGLADHYFAQATARVPLHWPSYYKYFMATTEKWGGSHKEMFRFAQKSAQGAPRGGMLHCLMALAYCEYALALEGAVFSQVRGSAHAARIQASLYAWLDASPATLEDRLHEVGSGFGTVALNHFAVACYLCGANQEAKALVAALNGTITTVPWAWIADGMRESRHVGFVHDRVQRELARA
jgi:hypothetical protein